MPEETVRERIKQAARDLGFQKVGIAPAERAAHADFFLDWLERGHHGAMDYMRRPDTVDRRLDPKAALPGASSIIVVAMNYFLEDDGPTDNPSRPVIARYARGSDYHDVFEEKLERLERHVRRLLGPEVATKAYVDYGPVLERDHAQRAGLGWIGKNTVLIDPEIGSYLFLGEILTDADLVPDEPFTADRCGSCVRCIEACPTGAIRGPRELDSRLCISYLTIELRGPIPRDLRPLIGNRVFGCDICQEVCPWNRHIPETVEGRFQPRDDIVGPELLELMSLTEKEFRERYDGTPLARARRAGFLRNVAVALGNWRAPRAVPVLAGALHDEEPLIRGHAAWALGRIGTPLARRELEDRQAAEPDSWVQEEIRTALASAGTE